jgi:cell division protein FtsQ
MNPVSAPSDRRFRRAHVKPRRGRRIGRVVTPLVVCAVLAVGVFYAASRGPNIISGIHVLRVERIGVQGNERLSTGEVLALLNGLRGQSLISTDLDRWRAELLASPWVEDATLRRSLPSTVEVVITERRPMGIGRTGGDTFLVDDCGTPIDQYGPQYADIDLPIIDGLLQTADDGTRRARAQLASRVIAAVGSRPDIAPRLSQIDVADPHDAVIILSGDRAAIHVGEDGFLTRLQGYLELAPALRERVDEIDSVDLRFGDRIFVKPTGRRSTDATRSGRSVAARGEARTKG